MLTGSYQQWYIFNDTSGFEEKFFCVCVLSEENDKF